MVKKKPIGSTEKDTLKNKPIYWVCVLREPLFFFLLFFSGNPRDTMRFGPPPIWRSFHRKPMTAGGSPAGRAPAHRRAPAAPAVRRLGKRTARFEGLPGLGGPSSPPLVDVGFFGFCFSHFFFLLAVWVLDCLVAWLFGCLVAWLQAWLLGCLLGWLLGLICELGWWFGSILVTRPL